MGTWDTGPFDNDTAADFCGDLDDAPEGERAGMVRTALLRAAATDTTAYLDSCFGDEAVAAAALVAAQCPRGEPVTSAYAPDEPLPDLTGLRGLAADALERVVAESSELMELWEGDPVWLSAVHRLREIVLPEPVGEQSAFESPSVVPVPAGGLGAPPC